MPVFQQLRFGVQKMTETKSIKHQVADVIVDVCGRLRLKTGWAEGMIIANALKDEGLLATELPKK